MNTIKIEYKGHTRRKEKAHKLWVAMAIAYIAPPVGEGMTVPEIVNDPRFLKADGSKYNRSYVYQVLAKLKDNENPKGGE